MVTDQNEIDAFAKAVGEAFENFLHQITQCRTELAEHIMDSIDRVPIENTVCGVVHRVDEFATHPSIEYSEVAERSVLNISSNEITIYAVGHVHLNANKRDSCKRVGVTLVEICYKDELTLKHVRSRLYKVGYPVHISTRSADDLISVQRFFRIVYAHIGVWIKETPG